MIIRIKPKKPAEPEKPAEPQIRIVQKPKPPPPPNLKLPPKPPKYRFGGISPKPKPVVVEQQGVEPPLSQTRMMKKITRDAPPNIPYLRFDAIAGRGGMATVWRCFHKELKRTVAVKVLDRAFAGTGQDIRQFMAEVRAMTDINHPGIVHGYGGDCVDGRYFFIMDYVDGYTFGSLLQRKRRIPQSDALIVCESVADAMGYAWDRFNMVHCDIKPENIMCDSDGRVKVADLGLCQSTNVIRSEENADEIVGTPAYMSPDQIYADQPLDCRADIYCLGATLYHLVTGRTLFPILSTDDVLRAHVDPNSQAPDPRTFNPALTENFVRLIGHMLVKSRDNRCQTWDDVLDAAQAVEEDRMILPIPEGVASSILINA